MQRIEKEEEKKERTQKRRRRSKKKEKLPVVRRWEINEEIIKLKSVVESC